LPAIDSAKIYMLSISVVSDAVVPRELPAEYRDMGVAPLFRPQPAAMRGEFIIQHEKPADVPVAREVAVLLMRALLTRRGTVMVATRIDSRDPDVIEHQLRMRLADLPLDPALKLDTVLRLKASNPTNHARVVTPHEFDLPHGWQRHPFPAHCELVNLGAGHSLLIEARIAAAVYSTDDPDVANTGGVVAYAVSAVPEKMGAAAALTAEPQSMRLQFDTHGYVAPTDVLRQTVVSAVDSLRKLSFDRCAVEQSDPLAQVFTQATTPIFTTPLGLAAVPGAALLLARLIYAEKTDYVAPGTDHRQESIVRAAAADLAAAQAQLAAAREKAVQLLERLAQQLVSS